MNKSVVDEIKNIDLIINDNILEKDYLGRGLLSQNILAQLRNLVEDFIVLDYNKKYNEDFDNQFQNKKKAYKDLYSRCKPKFLKEFHYYLQSSKSHYTPDYNGAERLMQKYYCYLLKLKNYALKEFNIEILNNISKYPLYNDKSLSSYYEKIADKVIEVKPSTKRMDNARYYIENIRTIYSKNITFYEITLSSATDKINKFDRMIVYSQLEPLSNYAITILYEEKEIVLFDCTTTIKIISNWKVAIRFCEFNNLSKIFSINSTIKSNMVEYNNLMRYLTTEKIDLLDLVVMSEDNYNLEKAKIGKAPTTYLFNLLERCRILIWKKNRGYKTIRYLLYTMRNMVIKRQLEKNEPLEYLSNLCLKKSCFPFEKIPFVMSLSNHIPSGEDLFLCLESNDCNDELVARHVYNNIEHLGIMYTPVDELSEYGNIDELINKFNFKLYKEQKRLKLIKEHNYLYMEGYEKDTYEIIELINSLTHNGISGYKESYEFWEMFEGYSQDIAEEKKEILRNLYCNSKVALIYGAAGTGKTTIINCISEYFYDKEKIFLANTNTALDNLKRRIKAKNSIFYNIAEYNKNWAINKNCSILIIDECSTVSNRDILKILKETKFELLLLVGDIHQIESINFGNWFTFCKEFVNDNSKHELSKTFRSDDESLLKLWEYVRNNDERLTEYLVNKNYSGELNKKIFESTDEDEITLCLGYDGLYGINQINKYLQDKNKGKSYNFGIKTFKIGDRVLFFDTKRFGSILYNNLKGTIENIIENDEKMIFKIEIEKPITELDVQNTFVDLIETRTSSSLIRFEVNKEFENDDDDEDKNNIVPFNIAYALSIHKAQGLEYNSVKVVLTKDVEKLITSNIFYTAITRAKKDLKIFWTAETEKYIINQINQNINNRDFHIFKNKYYKKADE